MPAQTRIIHYYVCLGAAGGKEWKVNMKTSNITNYKPKDFAEFQAYLLKSYNVEIEKKL